MTWALDWSVTRVLLRKQIIEMGSCLGSSCAGTLVSPSVLDCARFSASLSLDFVSGTVPTRPQNGLRQSELKPPPPNLYV